MKEIVMKMIFLGTAALLIAGASASAQSTQPSYATTLPACYSKTSPILDPHYGYDDRTCSQKLVEFRAVDEDGQWLRLQRTHPHYTTSVPACASDTSPILDPHYGYDDRDCAQQTDRSGA